MPFLSQRSLTHRASAAMSRKLVGSPPAVGETMGANDSLPGRVALHQEKSRCNGAGGLDNDLSQPVECRFKRISESHARAYLRKSSPLAALLLCSLKEAGILE